MARLRWLAAVAILAAATPGGLKAQQTGSITGRVMSAEEQTPLAGANILVVGTTRGAVSDQSGRYTITGVPTGQQRVRASVIGFAEGEQQVTVAAGAVATANFQMRASALQLSGIVVNAITGQVERKRTLGTNTAGIDATQIEKAPITKMADVLQGRAPGVTLQGVAGSVGTSQRIRIRGANSLSLSNEPLIYVDGTLISNSTGGLGVGGQDYSRLNDLSAEEMEKIEILKGPAASALYGTAAANGVVLITTKRGRAGKPQWKAYAEVGQIKDVNDYPLTYLTYQINNPNAPVFAGGTLNSSGKNPAYVACPNVLAATGSCRQDATVSLNTLRAPVLGPFSVGRSDEIGGSVSGGSQQVTYYLSADRNDQRGTISYNTFNKTNLRANLGANITDQLKVQVNTGYVRSRVALNSNDNSIFSPIINAVLAVPFIPTQEEIDASTPGTRPAFGFGFTPRDLQNLIALQDVDRFIVNSTGTWRPLPWLTGNVNLGLDFFSRFDRNTLQPGVLPIAASYRIGFRNSQHSNSYTYTGNGSFGANFSLTDRLTSATTVGTSYNRELFEGTSCYGAGIVQGTRSCSATSSLFSVDEPFSEIITIGGFARQEFGWNDRIFLAGSLRTDNNSAFGSNLGWVTYPSASLSYTVSEEPWFPGGGLFSNLRLRTAYGVSGLRPQFRDAITLLAPSAVTRNGSDVSAVQISRVGNPELRPERTREYEAGFDAGFAQDRLALEFTYFNKRSRDALIRRPLAPSFGLSGEGSAGSIFDNLGSIRNSGTETSLNARVLEGRNARLNLQLSATTLRNRIENLGNNIQPIIFGFTGSQRHEQGYPAGAFFQRSYSFNDADGNGKLSRSEVMLTSDTAVYQGQSLPTNTQSLNGDLTLFRYLTIGTLFERRGGNKQFNFTEAFRCRTGFNNAGGTGQCQATGDPGASLERQAAFVAYRYYGSTAGFIEDADFVKWRELSVTLGVPEAWSRHFAAIRGASVTLAGRNLATWTSYTGLDPEINTSGGSSNFNQSEFNTAPPVRYFTARVNFTF